VNNRLVKKDAKAAAKFAAYDKDRQARADKINKNARDHKKAVKARAKVLIQQQEQKDRAKQQRKSKPSVWRKGGR
jgi:hypothetical protein